jgi:hypothetical protein
MHFKLRCATLIFNEHLAFPLLPPLAATLLFFFHLSTFLTSLDIQ